MDTPVLSWDPDLPPPADGSCYCCCSCFALDTPIETGGGQYALIQNINGGDHIVACDVDLNWKPTLVHFRSGDIDSTVVPGLYHVEYKMPDGTSRYLLVTPDHLFLMTTRHLKKVQYLIPGDQLATPDGTAAVVQFVVRGEHNTSVQSIEMAGPVNPKTLEGHLLNCNGVVTADYAVQTAYEMDEGDHPHALHKPPEKHETHEVGSTEYHEEHGEHAKAFVDDPERWAAGFVPDQAPSMKIPRHAAHYLTRAQARLAQDNGEYNPKSAASGRANLLYLFQLNRMIYPDTICILDWRSDVPNAYAWQESGQKFIVVSGALARLKEFFMEGLSVVIATLQSSLEADACKCQWDYGATSSILRLLWPDPILGSLAPKGIRQVDYLFKLAGGDAEKPGPDPCRKPTLKCRSESLWAGLSFFLLPDCAGAFPSVLSIEASYASIDNCQIHVQFNDTLDEATVTPLANYLLSPAAEIGAAKLAPDNAKQIVLDVKLEPSTYYVLHMQDIASTHGVVIDPGLGNVIIRSNDIVEAKDA